MTVAGASRFLGAATLANTQGIAAQSSSLLSGSGSSTSLLEGGRNLAVGGFGISSGARAINQQFLSQSADINTLFSLGAGTDATVESARQEILALRAGLSDSQLSRGLRQDSGAVAPPETGQVIDQEA